MAKGKVPNAQRGKLGSMGTEVKGAATRSYETAPKGKGGQTLRGSGKLKSQKV